MLSQHPNVLARLREEVVTKLGSGANGRRPTHDDLRKMKYLRAVINDVSQLPGRAPREKIFLKSHFTLHSLVRSSPLLVRE